MTLRPMLAAVCEPANVKYPIIVQPKLDGIRCIIKDGVAFSRTLKPIRNRHIQCLISAHRDVLEGVDGELICGSPVAEDVYRITTSAVMSEHGEPVVTFYAFDLWNIPEFPYTKRLATLMGRMLPMEFVTLIQQEWATNEAELLEAHRLYTTAGYEGTILRGPLSPYKYNRSTAREGHLLKFKDFKDSEAVIIGFEEKMSNQNEAMTDERGYTKRSSHKDNMVPQDTLGALVVSFQPGTPTFKIGTGFDDSLRKQIWQNRSSLVGAIVKFKYFEGGRYVVPRFPVFLGFRDSTDFDSEVGC